MKTSSTNKVANSATQVALNSLEKDLQLQASLQQMLLINNHTTSKITYVPYSALNPQLKQQIEPYKNGVLIVLDSSKNNEYIEQMLNANSKIQLSEMALNQNSMHSKEQNSNSESNNLVKTRFLVRHSSKLLSIQVNQIAYFYAENRLNFIRTWNNKTYIIDKTIEELSYLLNKEDFFRINRSFIISYKSIEEVYTHFNSRLKLKLTVSVSEELFVSKERASDFKAWLGA